MFFGVTIIQTNKLAQQKRSTSILISILYLISLIHRPDNSRGGGRGRPYLYSPTVILRCFVVRIWFRLDWIPTEHCMNTLQWRCHITKR